MRARELRRAPGGELIGLCAAREKDGATAFATELALELTGADRSHRSQRAQAEQVESLPLLFIKR